MILPIRLGHDIRTRRDVFLHPDTFRTHYHLVGATGAGKTVAIQALLRPLLKEPWSKACVFVIDPMGNLSRDLLRFIATRRRLRDLRRRLLYIEPARESVVLPFNPLRYTSEANRYYQVARAVDLILRAWSAQDLASQPRLQQWSYKAMCAMAALDFPIAMSRFLLHPGTNEHSAVLNRIPEEIRHHWAEILSARGGSEAVRILESTRNRFDPFYESVILRRMFGSTQSRFDCERFIRDRRIVIVNLAKLGTLPGHLGSTIGALLLNEIFETAYNMTTLYGRQSVDPTYVLMDEFQKFVGPDIEDALPTVRQMGLRLILAHQSFAQLEQGDIDLSNMIWQARSRLMFANSAEDADIVAEELATITFDPMKIKDQRTSLKQLIVGYRKEWLKSEGMSHTHTDSTASQRSVGYNRSESESHRGIVLDSTHKTSMGTTGGETSSETSGDSHAEQHGRSEAIVPIHKTIEEVSNITYKPFDEHRLEWQRIIRGLRTGECFGQFVNDPHLYYVAVEYDPPSETKRTEDAVAELIEENFEQDVFISASEADRLAELDRARLLSPPRIDLPDDQATERDDAPPDEADPFRNS